MNTPEFKTIEAIYGIPCEEMPTRFERAVLVTQEAEFLISCEPEFDEIVITKEERKERTEPPILAGCFRVTWSWILTNQQGYTDGLRIEMKSEEDETYCYEFISIASGIEIHKSEKVRVNQSAHTTPASAPR
ncbi:DUF6334 family protein [Pelagicoccus albus]|uniref:Uncharacterized protein n=2 Tax=Pelagicoccus albus TaxID=415222 RepID=A0A7X1B369_9BACT|nr:DUF6334 family protein [Pelagicoccus albus]MBC2604811.1 hypothetical protein [Pelagicoccus albus]MBC2606314.1 hypothetical protein [Pelagicoccus albus]